MAIDRRKFMQFLGGSLLTPFIVTEKILAGAPQYSTAAGLLHSGDAGASDLAGLLPSDVFDLSVASGDPSASGAVLWTHIADAKVDGVSPLVFQIALDEAFDQLVLEGLVQAEDFAADRDFSVNIDVDGQLQANTRYYYRFFYRGVFSRTGRCKTLPNEGESLDELKVALLTCQDYTTGYYNAFHHLAEEDIDFVIHLGDFIYEYAQYSGFENNLVRSLDLPSGEKVAISLEDYRYIYRAVRSDLNLQKAMEQHTFIVTWDDHETCDNAYWDYERDTLGAPDHPFEIDEVFAGSEDLLTQLKLDSQRAWLEYIPARVHVEESAQHPHEYLRIYRQFKFGDMLELFMTDSRTYRSKQPCGDGDSAGENFRCRDYELPSQTMLGAEQKQWLIQGLTESEAIWKVWGNQTLMAQLALTTLGYQIAYANYDAWDGYQAERQEIMRAVKDNNVDNFVVFTGDLHTSIASYLKIDYSNINNWNYSNLVGVEVMTPSVTSPNLQDNIENSTNIDKDLRSLFNGGAQLNNPHIKDFNSSIYGYTVVEFSRNKMRWNVYDIDKRVDDPYTAKQLYRSFNYDPYWMWIR